MSGYVYVVKNGSNKYKIGYTKSSVKRRIATLQTALHSPIYIVAYFKTDNPVALERELHNRFNDKRLIGEWFSLDDDDVEWIKSMDGAILEEYLHPWDNKFIMGSQAFLEELSTRRDIGLQTMRVFIYLNARLDFDNYIHLKGAEIARELGIGRSHVSESLRKLKDLGIVLTGPEGTYRLNPNAGWKGKVRNLRGEMTRNVIPFRPKKATSEVEESQK
jgi:biotin operon repressor